MAIMTRCFMPPRQLVRILPQSAFGIVDLHRLERPQDLGLDLIFGELPVQANRLGDLRADRKDRVQAGGRLLEDHGDFAPANGGQLARGQLEQVAAVEANGSRFDPCGGLGHQLQHAQGGDGLAAAAFTDDRQGFAGADRKAHAVNRFGDPRLGVKVRSEILDGQQGFFGGSL
jgi:hypothetical protein